MIELIAAAVSGAVVGGGVVWWWMRGTVVDLHAEVIETMMWCCKRIDEIMQPLTALRSNCFIPDERGVKVRYSQASVERRVKAETPKEVK